MDLELEANCRSVAAVKHVSETKDDIDGEDFDMRRQASEDSNESGWEQIVNLMSKQLKYYSNYWLKRVGVLYTQGVRICPRENTLVPRRDVQLPNFAIHIIKKLGKHFLHYLK